MDNTENKALGKLTLVTPPSMIKPDDISFTIINFSDDQKQEFSDVINKELPYNNVTIFIWDNETIEDNWYKLAHDNSDYQINNKEDIADVIKKSKIDYDRRKFNM
tara:strand:+ start:16 stop:330 length:315 start_codon:yes stop_codon:yes gene_type:complete